MTAINASVSSTPTASSLYAAVGGAVKTDITGALNAAGLGSFASSQGGIDLIAKFSADAVSALRSSGSRSAMENLSKVLTSDVNGALNQFGKSGAFSSSQIAGFVNSLSADVTSAATSAGYGQTAATSGNTATAPGAASAVTTPATASGTAPASISSAASATPAPTTGASASSAAAISSDDTVSSIMKALAPLTGNGTQFTAVTSKIADALGKPRADGQTGVILSAVADKLRASDAAAAAKSQAPSTGGTAATSTANTGTAAPSNTSTASPKSSGSSSAQTSSAQTSAQAAVSTLVAIVTQNQSDANAKDATKDADKNGKAYAYGKSSNAA